MGIELHFPEASDEEECLSALKKSESLHGRWLQFDISPPGFAAYLARSRQEDQLSYLIRMDGKLAGFVNANNIVRGAFKSCFLGYGVFSGFENQGLMKAGLGLVVADLFENQGLHRAEANIQPENEPSKRLVASLGFEREGFSKNYLRVDGEWRDHERWAITVETWKYPSSDATQPAQTLNT